MTFRSLNFLYSTAWPQTNKTKAKPIKTTWYLKLEELPHKRMHYTHYC